MLLLILLKKTLYIEQQFQIYFILFSLPGVHIARRYGLGSSGSRLSICNSYELTVE